jgi:hypothetical protein
MKAKPGDYLLSKEKQLFRIVDMHVDTTGTYYDIRGLGQNKVYMKSIPRNRLRHLGKVILEEKMTKTMKILYG